MSQKRVEQNYYEILEVDRSSTQHEIVRAYQRAKSTYSPDSPALYTMFTPDEAKELLNLIEEAYGVLSHPGKRREYDTQLNDLRDHIKKDGPSPSANDSSRTSEINKKPSVTLPQGFARTRFSVYEIRPEFEAQIKNCTEFSGAFLQKVRTYKGINLEQMSNETRISRTYLAAVEAEDLEALPAAVFVRGFVVQVARVLGLPSDLAARSYMKRCYSSQ